MYAQELIGPAKPETDTVRLDAIRGAIEPAATGLHEILNDARVAGYFSMRATASSAASKAQARFVRTSLFSIVGAAVATLASGLLLYGASLLEAAGKVPETTKLVEILTERNSAIIFVQIAGALVAAIATTILSLENYATKWSDNRNRAEHLRRQIFTEILNKAASRNSAGSPPDGTNLLSQAFELFRRYQLDLQITYYEAKSRKNEISSSILSWITALLAGATAITGSIALFGGYAIVFAASLGIALPVMMSAAQTWGAVNLFGNKAKAYAKAHRELQDLALQLTEIRAAAAGGQEAVVRDFVDKVHEVMENENTNWVAAAPADGN